MIAIFNQDRTEIIYAFSIDMFDYGDKKSIRVWNNNGNCTIVGIYEPDKAMKILYEISDNITPGRKIYTMPYQK